LCFGACQKNETTKPQSPTPESPVQPQPSPHGVGSADFHLEIGRVYQRFGDAATAAEHFTRATQFAASAETTIQAHTAGGQLKEAAGDVEGAITSFEKALAVSRGAAASGTRQEIALQLGGLYVQRQRFSDAERLYDDLLRSAREVWQRTQVQRAQIELYRRVGNLEPLVAKMEAAAAADAVDETTLRFLATFYAHEVLAPGPRHGGPETVDWRRPLPVYEQLYRLHPEDLEIRRTLQMLLERSGRIDDAADLAAKPANSAPTAESECPGGLVPARIHADLAAAAEAVRVRWRAGQREVALAQTAKLAVSGRRHGVGAYLVAAQLYAEQGRFDLGSRALQDANRKARSPDDVTQVALAHEQELQRVRRAAELESLYASWARSPNACLRLAARERASQPLQLSGTAMATPPPP
jgi:tetratricopeptide (TPR) repeat protein